jgi:hypothetical protein
MRAAMDSHHSTRFSRFLVLILASTVFLATAYARQQGQSAPPQQQDASQQQAAPPAQKSAPQIIPQQLPPPPQPVQQKANEHKIAVPVDLVQIDATVTDKNGKLIKGLTRENFLLLEEGKPQKIDALDYFDVERIEVAGKEDAEPMSLISIPPTILKNSGPSSRITG